MASLQCATTHQERIGVNVSQAIKVLLQKYLAEVCFFNESNADNVWSSARTEKSLFQILMNVWRSRSHVVRIQSV